MLLLTLMKPLNTTRWSSAASVACVIVAVVNVSHARDDGLAGAVPSFLLQLVVDVLSVGEHRVRQIQDRRVHARVDEMLHRLVSLGVVYYSVAGSTLRIDWRANSLLEVARAAS